MYANASAPPPPPPMNPSFVDTPVTPPLSPAFPPANTSSAFFPPVNEPGAREYLTSCGWPKGLQDTFIRNLKKIPIRYYICDNSGSMSTQDGHRLLKQAGNKLITCTRWSELGEELEFHATLARTSSAVTEFRLLNGPPPIVIGDSSDPTGANFRRFMDLIKDTPDGGTPLCRHIKDVTEKIKAIAPQLQATGQKACLIIATDGESSDGDIIEAMRPLKDLPVWVVIRLCTDEENIGRYWNQVDNVLELNMDVLDDLSGEAKEIREKNPWLTYCESIHRMREFGVMIKELDLLDETTLSLDQIRVFCSLV